MIMCRGINTDLNLCKSTHMPSFTQTDRMMSKVITKYLWNYRNSFISSFIASY